MGEGHFLSEYPTCSLTHTGSEIHAQQTKTTEKKSCPQAQIADTLLLESSKVQTVLSLHTTPNGNLLQL